jgi:hypothetical protein
MWNENNSTSIGHKKPSATEPQPKDFDKIMVDKIIFPFWQIY